MYADVTPTLVEIGPGEQCSLSVRITNSTSLIDAYSVTVFGLDPDWVTVDHRRLSLFPSEAGDVGISIELPANFPAGHRQLSVHVRSENDPSSFILTPLGLVALGQPRLTLRMDPVVITGGKEATFGMIVANEGNTTITATASASEPEEKVSISIDPKLIELPAGHQEVIHATISGNRPWVGQHKVRVVTFAVDANTRTEAIATFIQKPRIGRWVLALMGLLAAAAVFAAVLSRTFDNVVKESSVDKGLLADALNKGGAGGQTVPVNPAVITGKVVLFSNGDGVAGVQADLYDTGDTKVPISTAATSDKGAYTFGRLNGGTYKIRFSGAGFTDVWYKVGATAADADEVTVKTGQPLALDDVKLGGRPGSVKGTVKAADLTDIKATLVVPGTVTDTTSAQVQQVDVSADGTFDFEGVPSPATYQLIVEKAGYATETRDVVVGPAQAVTDISITLRQGDGLITGHIVDATGPLGGVDIEATDGTVKVPTVTLTEGDVGAFSLRSLTTPQVYTLTISKDGYRSETRTISLSAAQQFDAGTITMTRSTGSISGHTSDVGGARLGGVTVTIVTGDTTITTMTANTADIGAYFADQLPIPATFSITFSKTGYVSQVRSLDLDPANNTADASAIDVALVPSTAIVEGVVEGVDKQVIPGAIVVLSDGTNSRQLVSANDPLGHFIFSGVAPGAYTVTASLPGTSPSVTLVNVVANDDKVLEIRLETQASATGQVTLLNNATNIYEPYPGAVVRLFLPADFPGPASSAIAATTTDANGNFTFNALNAPQNYVVAVYQNASSPDPLDSQLILTQPSTQLTVPTFQIPLLF